MTLPSAVIRSLISNTLPYDYYNNREVRRYVDNHGKLTTHPGTYCNIPALGYQPLTQHAGKWLSYEQVTALHRIITSYLGPPSPQSNAVAMDIDCMFQTPEKCVAIRATPGQRAYARNSSQNHRIREWLAVLEEQYTTQVSPAQRNQPFQRSLIEVGWAVNVQRRVKAHTDNGNTTYIYALVNAITRQSSFTGAQFPRPLQMTLFRVWKIGHDLTKIAEITASLLCSSYAWLGGLNAVEAGNVSFGTVATHSVVWAANQRFVFQGLDFNNNLREEWLKVQKVDETLDLAESLPKDVE